MVSFRIAQWTVHPVDGTLTDGEQCGRLEPKVMGLLVYLATHPGRVIGKEELLGAVWPDTHVQEVALSRSISEIRRQLGDDARSPRFIETLPKRGYRLMVPVERLSKPPVDDRHPEVESIAESGRTAPRRHLRWAVGLALVLGALGLWITAVPTTSSVAVMPFRNLGEDLAMDYFSAGMTEDLTARLSQVGELRVKPLATGASNELAPRDLSRLGSSAHVDAVLDGSVRREGERIRVVARLVEVESGEILWADSYDHHLEGIFDLQQELANRITRALEASLSPSERQRLQEIPTDRVTAYDYYLRGRDKYQRYQPSDNELAITLYQRALELDPNFALAHAELASAYALRVANYGADSSEVSLAAAREAVARAFALAPNLPEAHKARGILDSLEGRPRRALAAYERALELRPDYREAENNIAFLRVQLGQWDGAGRWQPRGGGRRLE